ncbi:cyclic-di-AMP-binding protein CbpB [Enterococcus timonensis]|uniref:cyclic-di-AMP-binding protein CbpB n=1 Tax=Enterococcus timonensis TaxID=1852364 RepID=UPI0008D9549E|nr:cyclic-di-AMP-binding protein CbpB [Enterococcus timonensis]
MIGPYVSRQLLEKKDEFMIDGEKIASLMDTNPLSHALLVLSKVKYAKIPVLDKESHFVGLIGLADIMSEMIELTRIDSDNLHGKTVKEAMETGIPTLQKDFELEDLLHLLVDHSFIPVVDEENHFEGIYTRREILKATNRLAHQLEANNIIIPKSAENQPEKNLKII